MAITLPYHVTDWSNFQPVDSSIFVRTAGEPAPAITADATGIHIAKSGVAVVFEALDYMPKYVGHVVSFETTATISSAATNSNYIVGIGIRDGSRGYYFTKEKNSNGHSAIYTVKKIGLGNATGTNINGTFNPQSVMTGATFTDSTQDDTTVKLRLDINGKHIDGYANDVHIFSGTMDAQVNNVTPIFAASQGDISFDGVFVDGAIPAPPSEGTISTAPSIPAHTSGDTVALSTLFTVPSTIIGDLDITLNPTNAGTYDETTHLITLSSSFTGSLTVTATAKAGVTITGSPATATFQVNAVPVQPPSGNGSNGSTTYPPATRDIPDNLNIYNHPNLTALQIKFWGSKHVCNHTKAIIAFAFNLKNANDSLRRYGYTRGWRTKALYHYGKYINNKEMTGIPFTEMSTPWYAEMFFVKDVTIDSVLAGHIAP